MDADGIDAAFLYPSLGLFAGAVEEPGLAAAMCRAYNRRARDARGSLRSRRSLGACGNLFAFNRTLVMKSVSSHRGTSDRQTALDERVQHCLANWPANLIR